MINLFLFLKSLSRQKSSTTFFYDKTLKTSLGVSLLGYLIDQYDLGLFAITRVASLKSMGLDERAILSSGITLLNVQMLGMLFGGIVGGIIGDKWGRVKVLYASMFLYAAGNIANAFIHTVGGYGICRFISGVGLASEMGACLTIIAESLRPQYRNFGMMTLIVLGHVGGITAAFVAPRLTWQNAYLLGGVMGLILFVIRLRVKDSILYERARSKGIRFGDIHKLLAIPRSAGQFVRGILVGLPVYFVSGILLAFAPEIGQSLGVHDAVRPSVYFPLYYGGIILGDLTSAILAQKLRSLRKSVFVFQGLIVLFCLIYFNPNGLLLFYSAIGLLGFASGHWVLVNTLATEQFGTNVRASVATITPNFIRASVFLLNLSFAWLKSQWSVKAGALGLGVFVLALSLTSLLKTKETHGKDLDFVEQY